MRAQSDHNAASDKAGKVISNGSASLEPKNQEQNLFAAWFGGSAASIAGAFLWASVTLTTHSKSVFMAIFVGVAVGLTIRVLGKGFDPIFGYIGSALSFTGSLAGNLLSVTIMSAHETWPFLKMLARIKPSSTIPVMIDKFQPIDFVFYGIAVYAGFRLSFRKSVIGKMRTPR